MTNQDEWILDQQIPMISLKKWQSTINLIAKLYESPAAYVLQHTSNGFQIVISSNARSLFSAGQWFSHQEDLFSKKVVETCGQLYVNNARHRHEWRDNPLIIERGINSYLGIPVYWSDGTTFGVICVVDYASTHYSKLYLELLWQFRDIIEADLMLNNQFLQLLELSNRDDLSRLSNRHGFFAQADKHVQLAQRLNQSIGLLYLNIENLKQINQEHGHRIGDKAIRALASCIKAILRNSDIAGRIGGNEFVILLVAQKENALLTLSRRIQQELTQFQTDELASIPMTINIYSGFYPAKAITRIDRMITDVEQNPLSLSNTEHNPQANAG